MLEIESKGVYYKLLFSSIAILLFGIYLSIRSGTKKEDFQRIDGNIDFIKNTFNGLNPRDHKYIHVSQSNLVFDLFIGNKTGDFSPQFEQIDQLKEGDLISIYYADESILKTSKSLELNKTVQFIDKGSHEYYVRGNKDKYGGYIFIGLGFLITCILLIVKRVNQKEMLET